MSAGSKQAVSKFIDIDIRIDWLLMKYKIKILLILIPVILINTQTNTNTNTVTQHKAHDRRTRNSYEKLARNRRRSI